MRRHVEEPAPLPQAALTVGSLPLSVNLMLYQGDDFFLNIVVTGGGITDMTGYTVEAVVRRTIGDTEILATFDGSVVDPTTVRLHLPSAESTKLIDKAVWDAQVVDPVGVVTTLAYGAITLAKEVTT